MPFQDWPFSNIHNVNLDWVLTQLQEVFRRLTDLKDQIDSISISTGVLSVNRKTGVVTLNAEDVGALPAGTPIPSKVSELRNDLDFQTGQEVQTAISPLQTKAITDTGGYFTTDTVEGALQEIGAELAGINTLIGSGVII